MLDPEAIDNPIDNLQLSTITIGDVTTAATSVNDDQSRQSIAGRSRIVFDYIAAALADNTRRAYQCDLHDFQQWGGTIPCLPEMLAQYVADRAETLSPVTITRRVTGISRAHASQGLVDPAKNDLIKTLLRGIRRKNGRPQRQAAPLLKQDLLNLLPLMTGPKGARDRALILLGFAAALRRSELVALDYSDVAFVSQGLVVRVRRSKIDQEGHGREIAVPFGRSVACPVKAVSDWLALAGITAGPIFRSVSKAGQVSAERLPAQSVSLIVKSYARALGLPASEYSGHSLRAGLATSAAQAGASTWKIREQTGHKSDAMLARYIRAGTRFQDNAAGFVL